MPGNYHEERCVVKKFAPISACIIIVQPVSDFMSEIAGERVPRTVSDIHTETSEI